MNIELTKEQYQKLLKAVFLGNWVINASRDPEERFHEFEDLFTFLVEQDKETSLDSSNLSPFEYFQNDTEIQEFLEEFAEDTFWEELIQRLAMRDIVKMLGDQIEEVDQETLETLAGGVSLKYLEEFEEHELDNVLLENVNLEDFEMKTN